MYDSSRNASFKKVSFNSALSFALWFNQKISSVLKIRCSSKFRWINLCRYSVLAVILSSIILLILKLIQIWFICENHCKAKIWVWLIFVIDFIFLFLLRDYFRFCSKIPKNRVLYGKLILLPNPTKPAIVGEKINFHIFHRKTRKVNGFFFVIPPFFYLLYLEFFVIPAFWLYLEPRYNKQRYNQWFSK